MIFIIPVELLEIGLEKTPGILVTLGQGMIIIIPVERLEISLEESKRGILVTPGQVAPGQGMIIIILVELIP